MNLEKYIKILCDKYFMKGYFLAKEGSMEHPLVVKYHMEIQALLNSLKDSDMWILLEKIDFMI